MPTGSELSSRLAARRAEIEQTLRTRIYAIAEVVENDLEYQEGLRNAVSIALDYGLTAIETGEARAPPVPVPLLTQARLAARVGVRLNAVLRRYVAGYTLLDDYLAREANATGLSLAKLNHIVRQQAIVFDRLLAKVSLEYEREPEQSSGSAERYRRKRILGLVAGEPLDTSDLPYDFEGAHLGAIASGSHSAEAIRLLFDPSDARLLLVRPDENTAWGWVGAHHPDQLKRACCLTLDPTAVPGGVVLAIGELTTGLDGWHLTHRQARAALPVAHRTPERFVRYRDVALLTSILKDETLAASLQQIFLAPLELGSDKGTTLRSTLEAYVAADRSTSVTAAALGVTRQTIRNRLAAVEERLGRSLKGCMAEVEAALLLHRARGRG